LIVNPVAGIGGRVGLKGSDGAEIQKKALALGAVPESLNRAIQALERIKVSSQRFGERNRVFQKKPGFSSAKPQFIEKTEVKPIDNLEIITYPGEMGEDAARACGFEPTVIGSIKQGATTPEDTRNAAREMLRLNVDLLLFAGGDGTARDIYNAVAEGIPVLGIPAGVKIHSAVFGTSPRNAGDLAALHLQGRGSSLREAEVMDIDEVAFRQGVVSARLYGYLNVPFRRGLVQSLKIASNPGEEASLEAIACDIVDRMEHDCLYIIGPGTTTRAITSRLGLDKTLIGVDVVARGERKEERGEREGRLVATDVNESQLLRLIEGRNAKIIVTPIGGQGYIFGRGNQQISPEVIGKVGRDNIIVVSTPGKINSLGGRLLWVDTGDREVDETLSGYTRVVTGYNEQIVYKVSC